jgi:hypothetical protein
MPTYGTCPWSDATRQSFEEALPPDTYVIYEGPTRRFDELDLDISAALVDCSYIDDWPLPGDPAPHWLPPNARLHKPSRWLPPRCHLPALVPRRDFPRLAPA